MSLVSEEAQERIVKARNHYYRLMTAIVVVTAVAVLYGLVTGSQDRQLLKEQGRLMLKQSALLVECTTDPAERKDAAAKVGEDDCFVRATNRTAAAVGQIGDLSVVAAACGAANPGDIGRTRRCVEEALAE